LIGSDRHNQITNWSWKCRYFYERRECSLVLKSSNQSGQLF